jgi:FkbM family methyltransferase
VFLRLGARVVAVEPDESNQRLLARRYLGRLRKRPVTIVGNALSDTVRTDTFWVNSPGSGLNTLSKKWVQTLKENTEKFGATIPYPDQRTVETTTLALLMAAHGAPRYIKIDVEGHECHVLRGLSHPVPFVSFEAILPEFALETNECIQILSRLSPSGLFNISEECYKGLSLREWHTGPEIVAIMGGLGERTVEVYWRDR